MIVEVILEQLERRKRPFADLTLDDTVIVVFVVVATGKIEVLSQSRLTFVTLLGIRTDVAFVVLPERWKIVETSKTQWTPIIS